MRQVRNPQMELGEVRIEEIELDRKSRDDFPALLLGLQYLHADKETRTRLFALLEEYMLPGIDRSVGRPGMDMWRILVMGVVISCDPARSICATTTSRRSSTCMQTLSEIVANAKGKPVVAEAGMDKTEGDVAFEDDEIAELEAAA